MIASIAGIIIGLGIAMFCMVRSWQCYRQAGDTRESRVVSVVVAILFGGLGTVMSLCTWRELMELLK